MSHQPERKEKDCLNCGTIVQGRFCQKCGQENIVTHQTFWGLTKHFVYDIFHFDGKFFNTLKAIFVNPGVVAKEYVQGKRMKYLDPIRMYLFTSALFFLLFFSLNNIKPVFSKDYYWQLSTSERMEFSMLLSQQIKANPTDSLLRRQLTDLLDSTKRIEMELVDGKDTSGVIEYKGKRYKMAAEKITNTNEVKNPDNWFNRILKKRSKEWEKKFKDNPNEGLTEVLDIFLHRLPYLFFLSLPFFAGILKLLYVRRKKFFYSDHAIFTLYQYILGFILMILIILFLKLQNISGWSFFRWMIILTSVALPVYLLIGMRDFYMQRFGKTFAKFLLLNILGFIVLQLLFVVFFVLSIIM